MDPVRVRVPHVVEPVVSPVLSEAWAGKEPVHGALVRVRPLVRDEGVDLGRRGGESGQVQAHPSQEAPFVGLLGKLKVSALEPVQDEAVDGILGYPRCFSGRGDLGRDRRYE